jgi:hypothetical protein
MQLISRSERALPILSTGICRQGNRRGPAAAIRRGPPHLLNEGVAVFVGHTDVGHDDVRDAPLDVLQRPRGRVEGRHVRPDLSQHGTQNLPRISVVVDDDHMDILQQRQLNRERRGHRRTCGADARGHGHHGSR